jgi:hypothetical protein
VGTDPQHIGSVETPLVRAGYTGGSGTFANGAEIKVPKNAALAITFNPGSSATVQGRYNASTLGQSRGPTQYQTIYYSGALYEGVVPSAADANVLWEVVPDVAPPFPNPPTGSGAQPSGLYYVPGGTVLTSTLMATVVSNGYAGIYLDPRQIYTVDPVNGWIFNSTPASPFFNFTVESRMGGVSGYGSIIENPAGYVNTATTNPDGVAVYGSNNAGIARVIFRYVAFIGPNTNGVMHSGSKSRSCVWDGCFFNNTSTGGTSLANAPYSFIADTALGSSGSDNEYNVVQNCEFACTASPWGVNVGIGIADQSQKCNNWRWTNVNFNATYCSWNHVEGGNHFTNGVYDRGNPTLTSFNLQSGAGALWINGTELHNMTGSNYNVAGGTLVLNEVQESEQGSNDLISGGHVSLLSGQILSGQGWTLSGTGVLDTTSNNFNSGSGTVTGSAGTLIVGGPNVVGQSAYGAPTYSAFTGTILYSGLPHTVPWTTGGTGQGTGATGTITLQLSPPVAGMYRITVNVRVTVAGTSTVVTAQYKNDGGGTTGPSALQMYTLGTLAGVTSIVATGAYSGTAAFYAETGADTLEVIITPTGSTFSYDASVELLKVP